MRFASDDLTDVTEVTPCQRTRYMTILRLDSVATLRQSSMSYPEHGL
jgi:hypothetical protein